MRIRHTSEHSKKSRCVTNILSYLTIYVKLLSAFEFQFDSRISINCAIMNYEKENKKNGKEVLVDWIYIKLERYLSTTQ